MKLSKENKNITVSICVITYNQENYIDKVLEYLLDQKTDFKYEIVIGEDYSHDNTRQICEAYQQKHPELINLILNKKNLGLIGNFIKVISECQGKYIAMCAGDDYWIDDLKLQKQVDFLGHNPGYSMCSTEAFYNKTLLKRGFRSFVGILYKNFILDGYIKTGQILSDFFFRKELFWQKRRQPPKLRRFFVGTLETVLEDLFAPRYYAASSNIVRREVFEKIPIETFDYTAEHIVVILWSALFGKIKLLKDVSVVKNEIETSISKNKSMQKHFGRQKNYKSYINLLKIAKDQEINENKKLMLSKKIDEFKTLDNQIN